MSASEYWERYGIPCDEDGQPINEFGQLADREEIERMMLGHALAEAGRKLRAMRERNDPNAR